MEINEAILQAVEQLNKKGLKNSALEAEILLSDFLGKSRAFILAHTETKLTEKQATLFKELIKKRAKGLPSAYLSGHKEFYGLDFLVNKNVLIPRPETELMVEEAFNLIKKSSQNNLTIIDIGTGSGCIIIALAKLLEAERLSESRKLKLIAVDISQLALVTAKKNARLNGLAKKIKFVSGNLLDKATSEKIFKDTLVEGSGLIILANLPYLTPSQIKSSPTIKYEPKLALDGGSDGLKLYARFFKQVRSISQNRSVSLLCEIDHSQVQKIKKLAQSELPASDIVIKKDLAGLNRLVIIRIV